MTVALEDWLTANQQSLMAEVASVGALLRGEAPESPTPQPALEGGSALDAVTECFGLSPFERRLLVLAAAPELDGAFGATLAGAQGAAASASPTFGLALAAFPDAHWSALAPWAPIRRWRLVEVGPGPLAAAPLRIDEWVLHALAGTPGLDPRLAGIVEPLWEEEPLVPSGEPAVDALIAAWARRTPGPPPGPVTLIGPSRGSMRAVFAAACARLDWHAFTVSDADLPAAPPEREELVTLWARQALLGQAALLVDVGHSDDPARKSAVSRFVDRLATPAAVATGEGYRPGQRPGPVLDVPRPTAAEQRNLWAAALQPASAFGGLNGSLDRLVAQFDLDATGIALAANRAAAEAVPEGAIEGDPGARLWDACRRSARGGLDDLAERLETAATFDDLVLPEAQRALLGAILAHVRHRSLVYGRWGMAGPSKRGLGVSALFAGPSGTGKTLAAEVLANALALDLYRIDLSQAVSKYIGETEKNLRRIFAGAAGSGAVLLFDEADALFGKRSEVRDSHDRYANVEISYLLQAMESYRGLAVLTTNMRQAIDSAFGRRIRFVVTFPFPGLDERAEIWRRAFPAAAPVEGLDWPRLAQLSVAGGTIRAIALHAAFAAADAGEPIGMGHVLQAAGAEYAKLERPLSDAELAGWPR